MDQQLFTSTCKDLKKNITKVLVDKNDHLQNRGIMSSGLNFADDSVRSQYIELINPGLNLGSVTKKLNKLDNVVHDRRYVKYHINMEGGLTPYIRNENLDINRFNKMNGGYIPDENGEYVLLDENIDAKELSDQLIRYCELNRKQPIFAYRHEGSGLVYGIVSQRHTLLQDIDVFDIINNRFEDIPHTYQFEHNNFRMRVGIILDEIAVELGGEKSIKFRISAGNSMFGVGSAFVVAGSFEMWCKNGAMGWRTKAKKEWRAEGFLGGFEWSKIHVYNPSYILRDLSNALNDQLGKADKYLELIENANEADEPIFKQNDDIIKKLTEDKFKLHKTEAEEVYKLMKTKTQQYGRFNGFDTGRAIAEVARDIPNLTRRFELERISGKIMFAQV